MVLAKFFFSLSLFFAQVLEALDVGADFYHAHPHSASAHNAYGENYAGSYKDRNKQIFHSRLPPLATAAQK